MSEYVWEDAWVLLSVKYAQGESGSAKKEDVIKAGDFINHAKFLDREIDHAIKVFSEPNLMYEKDGIFSLGSSFTDLWSASGAENHRGVQKQLEKLISALGIGENEYQS